MLCSRAHQQQLLKLEESLLGEFLAHHAPWWCVLQRALNTDDKRWYFRYLVEATAEEKVTICAQKQRTGCERYIGAQAPLVLFTGSHRVSLNHPKPLWDSAESPYSTPTPPGNILRHTLVSPKPYINVSAQQWWLMLLLKLKSPSVTGLIP